MVAMQWKLGVSLALLPAVAFAEEGVTTGSFPVERRNVVTVAVPLQNLDQLSLEGEHVLGEHFSVGLGVLASFTHDRLRRDEDEAGNAEGFDSTYYRFGLAPGVRFYLTGKAPQGLWLSPRLEVAVGRNSSTVLGDGVGASLLGATNLDAWSIGGTATLGYSVVLEPGFTVQGGVALGARREAVAYDSIRLGTPGEVDRIHETSWLLTQRIVLNVGWAF
ncbi:hypothetical protein HMI49_31120 [Corallococcus exercitus]|uniref:Outer membrane protein beta-barrel domain-containing protein n=1 Tax=Corallococcus exercitus TaxID=2316736 RepID=A0A7Y4KPR0_9BACT|nr:hypothetical protein [Corallococcus exercitus]NOK37660.1 hypothetical protein [Corallococcus exercitus]